MLLVSARQTAAGLASVSSLSRSFTFRLVGMQPTWILLLIGNLRQQHCGHPWFSHCPWCITLMLGTTYDLTLLSLSLSLSVFLKKSVCCVLHSSVCSFCGDVMDGGNADMELWGLKCSRKTVLSVTLAIIHILPKWVQRVANRLARSTNPAPVWLAHPHVVTAVGRVGKDLRKSTLNCHSL